MKIQIKDNKCIMTPEVWGNQDRLTQGKKTCLRPTVYFVKKKPGECVGCLNMYFNTHYRQFFCMPNFKLLDENSCKCDQYKDKR